VSHFTPSDVAPSRRDFLRITGTGLSVVAVGMLLPRAVSAQDEQPSAGVVEMSSDSYKPVQRPPKPNAVPQLTSKELDAFEINLACPCPCTLDIYTCRTTDFNCGISPAVHGDIKRLVEGGYSADEIMEAMTGTYGDFILMTPRKRGFNLLAWFAPFAAIGFGAVGIGALLRSWRRNSDAGVKLRAERDLAAPAMSTNLDATPEELDRLAAALREEG